MSAITSPPILVLSALFLAPAALARGWDETGDAPSFPELSAQVTRGESLDSISGSTSTGDPRDAYCLRISEPSGFLATTDPRTAPTADADFDTRLFLFRPDGAPLLANDDSPSGLSEQSTLTGSTTGGSGFSLAQPGEYVLVIGGSPDSPQDPVDGALFDIATDLAAVHPANPTSGRFDHWQGEAPDIGSYEIVLVGAAPCENQLDAVFANIYERDRVCIGDGSGGFTCSNIDSNETRTQGLTLGFVDGDPHLDAMLAKKSSGPNRVCLGDGAGGFSCRDVGTDIDGGNDAALGFVDGDQHLDTVFAYDSPPTNRICLGNGTGDFTCSDVSDDAYGSAGLALGFIDGDPHLDAVFANWSGQRNRVCLGNGAGSFACSDVSSDANTSVSVALGFVNGDSQIDAVFANVYQRNRVCLGNGSGGFSCSDVSSDYNNTCDVAMGLINGDQNLDAVFANGFFETNRVCLGDGAGGFTCSDIGSDAHESASVALGLVDNDPHLDAVFANWRDEANRVCFGDGAGGFDCSDVSSDTNNSMGVALGDVASLPAVFADGFETGDCSAWSGMVP